MRLILEYLVSFLFSDSPLSVVVYLFSVFVSFVPSFRS